MVEENEEEESCRVWMSQTGSIRGLTADGKSPPPAHPSGAHNEFVEGFEVRDGRQGRGSSLPTFQSAATVTLLPFPELRPPSGGLQPASQLVQTHL